jgi:hypothetical protein
MAFSQKNRQDPVVRAEIKCLQRVHIFCDHDSAEAIMYIHLLPIMYTRPVLSKQSLNYSDNRCIKHDVALWGFNTILRASLFDIPYL